MHQKHARLWGFVSLDLFRTDLKCAHVNYSLVLQFLSLNQQLLDSDFVADKYTFSQTS